MALSYDLGRIADWENVCKITATEDDPMNGVKKGDRIQNPVTTTLIWATMAVGMGSITEQNAQQFYCRLAAYEKLFGPMMYRGTDWPEGQEPNITAEDVILHIGLGTNVSLETDAKWKNRIFSHFVGDASKRFTRASEKLAA